MGFEHLPKPALLIVLHDGDLDASESVLVFNGGLVMPCENYLSNWLSGRTGLR